LFAQLRLSNNRIVAGDSADALPDPLPTFPSTGDGGGLLLPDGAGELLAAAGVEDACDVGDGEDAALAFGDGEDAALALGDADADLAPALCEADGVGDGVVMPDVKFGATYRTSRIRSRAVSPTRVATFCAPAPGTDTTISSLPCCTTDAPVRPVASTRFVMI
jgi:hypothetical protein